MTQPISRPRNALLSDKDSTTETVEMLPSTRCKFCGSFWDKAVPSVCPDCWAMVQEYVSIAKKEL